MTLTSAPRSRTPPATAITFRSPHENPVLSAGFQSTTSPAGRRPCPAAAAVRSNCVRAEVVRSSPPGLNLTRARPVVCCIMNKRSRALLLERLISSALAQGVVVSVAPDKKGRRVITVALSGVDRPAGSLVRSGRASVHLRRRRRRQRRSWVQVISTPMRD